MAPPDSLLDILRLLYRWRVKLIGAALAIAALTVVITLFMPDYYRSETVFYAASTDMANPDDLFGPVGRGIEYFGTGADRDRLLTIAGSTPFLDRMIDSFELMTRYDIDASHPKARERARLRFGDHYEIIETKYDGIRISVEDKEPAMAAAMANAARTFIDRIAVEYLRANQERMLLTLNGSINTKQAYLVTLSDSLSRTQQSSGVYDAREQGRQVGFLVSQKTVELAGDRARLEMYRKIGYQNRDTIANVTARIASLETELADLTGKTQGRDFDIHRFNAAAGLVAMLQQQYENTKNQLSYEIEKANHLRAILEGEISAIIPFEEAMPAVSKHRPKRGVLAGISFFLTLLFGALFVLIREQYRRDSAPPENHGGH
ncbi:MAG: hypothetical protein J5I41_09445 [Saprospiraceae bacterium]|nr:hypothetical protein [Saprospiraceae bacterium]